MFSLHLLVSVSFRFFSQIDIVRLIEQAALKLNCICICGTENIERKKNICMSFSIHEKQLLTFYTHTEMCMAWPSSIESSRCSCNEEINLFEVYRYCTNIAENEETDKKNTTSTVKIRIFSFFWLKALRTAFYIYFCFCSNNYNTKNEFICKISFFRYGVRILRTQIISANACVK